MSRIYDISQILRPEMPVWPGDTPFSLTATWEIASGAAVNVSRLVLSTHSGAHADAPRHYLPDGEDSATSDLSVYIGPALVADLRSAGDVIRPCHLKTLPLETCQRLLLRTYETFPHQQWTSAFTSVDADAIEFLAGRGIRLIGIDSPSLDPETSRSMDAHHAVARSGMRIIEGIVLDHVPPGLYELIALPLRISGADASPVRAILRELK
jgi:arylformamidase